MAIDTASLVGGGLMGMLAGFLVVFLVIFAIMYVFVALALMNIAKKTNTPNGWLAWVPIANGIIGSLFGYQYYQTIWVGGVKKTVLQDYMWFQSWNIVPNTNYTLIYYGNGSNNDIWPYATCIQTKKSTAAGYLTMSISNFKWSNFLNDGIDQKFWLVRTSDVDCLNNKMIAWNPANYLFESQTI